MNSPCDVAILIPTFNRATLLVESVRSALGQTRRPAEVIVIDDGSTDETPSAVAQFGDAVRYLPVVNGGKSAAINAGLALSRSGHILVLDDDDLLPPNALEQHLAALEGNPEAGLSYGLYSRFRPGRERPSESTDIEPVDPEDDRRLFIRLIEHDFLPNPSWLVRRQVMDAVGPYSTDLKRSQDLDMILRITRHHGAAMVPAVVLWQREHIAARGHETERLKTVHTIDLWVKYDAIMMASIDATTDDHDYAPFDDEIIPASTVILQRAVSNFQRNNFKGALEHLTRYRGQAGRSSPSPLDKAIGGRLLAASHGLGAALAAEPAIDVQIGALGLHPELARAMASQAAWRFKTHVSQGQYREAARLWRFTTRAFGINPIAARRHRQGPYPRPSETLRHGERRLSESRKVLRTLP